MQRHPVLRVAEKLVERLFDLAERGAQFIHHAAHGLAVADPAVEVLHPDFEGLRWGARHYMVEPLRQTRTTFCHA
jgi:hypothetical protein